MTMPGFSGAFAEAELSYRRDRIRSGLQPVAPRRRSPVRWLRGRAAGRPLPVDSVRPAAGPRRPAAVGHPNCG
jgi:hypothetical protein